MAWVVKLAEVIDGKVVTRSKVTTMDRPAHLTSHAPGTHMLRGWLNRAVTYASN